MAWVNPVEVAAGDPLTETLWNQDIVANSIMGRPVFTNEAARDAAISSPSEGMIAYLTSPTVPAATGNVTAIPTGVTTVYNGSVWVCTTPVIAKSNVAASTTSTSYVTTLTGDGTAVSVTLVTGTTALVTVSAQSYNSTGNSNYTSVSVSGATTLAAADAQSAAATIAGVAYGVSLNRTQVLTGLTAGTNTFTLNYRVNAGTGTNNNRDILVVGIA